MPAVRTIPFAFLNWNASGKLFLASVGTNQDVSIAPIGSGKTIVGGVVSLPTDGQAIQWANNGANGKIYSSGGSFNIEAGAGAASSNNLRIMSVTGRFIEIGGGDGVKLQNTSAIKGVRTATATLDFASIPANGGTQSLTVTVTGAVVGDSVHVGLPAAPNAGVVFNAFVSAADTVTIRATNCTAGAIDPASATYRVTVVSF